MHAIGRRLGDYRAMLAERLKSPKPLYQLMAVGHDAQTIAKWQGAH